MTVRKRMTILLLTGSIAGCTGSTDPTSATLFDNIQNLNSGEYDRQVRDANTEAARISQENRAQQGTIASLENQSAANQQTIQSLRGEISSLRSSIDGARAQAAGDAEKLGKLTQLDTQLRAVDASLVSGGDTAVARREVGQVRSAFRALSS